MDTSRVQCVVVGCVCMSVFSYYLYVRMYVCWMHVRMYVKAFCAVLVMDIQYVTLVTAFSLSHLDIKIIKLYILYILDSSLLPSAFLHICQGMLLIKPPSTGAKI